MRLPFLLPAYYFFRTRLSGGSTAFHAVFEWGAALLLILVFPASAAHEALFGGILAYLAFISVYELGYLMNDYYAFSRESNGRDRRVAGLQSHWIAGMVVSRLLVFAAVSLSWPGAGTDAWWCFFGALGIVFCLHNLLRDPQLKLLTFAWLSWLRFMAPVIFVVQADQLMGISFGAAAGYVGFRALGYLDSKGMLTMPDRKGSRFRGAYFLSLTVGILVLWPHPEARGFLALAAYYAVASATGITASMFSTRAEKDTT